MNITKKILLLVICLAIVPFVFAGNTERDYFWEKGTNAPVTGVQMLVYTCADSECRNVVGEAWFNKNSGTKNYIDLEFPGTAKPTQYAEYFYKKGYLPFEATFADWGTGKHYVYNNYFEKAYGCHAPIDTFTITNTVYANEPLIINVAAKLDAKTYSAFTDAGTAPFYVPAEYKDEYYSVKTDVVLNIYNPSGVLVYSDVRHLNLYMDTSQQVSFSWTPSVQGNGYTAEIITNIVDDQCGSSIPQKSSKVFNVLASRPRNECYTLLNGLRTDNPFPKVGDIVNIFYEKISNYADNNYVKTAVPMTATYTIRQGQSNPNGVVVYSETLTVPATSTTEFSTQSFSWKPASAGWYTIYVSGVCSSSLCGLNNNPVQTASLEIYVGEVQKYNIIFTVRDLDTAKPIEGTNVVVDGKTAMTDSNGKAVFSGFAKGTYAYTVSKNGYNAVNGNVVVANADVYVDVQLSKSANNNPVIISKPVTTGVVGKEYAYDVDAVDYDGDKLKYSLTTAPNGMTIDSLSGLIKWVPSAVGKYAVTVRVEDGRGGYAIQSYEISVSKKDVEEVIESNELYIAKLRIVGEDNIKAGDKVAVAFSIQNVGDKNLKELKVDVSIPEISARESIGPLKLNKGESASKTVYLEIPSNAKGWYDIRFTINNNYIRRVVYRDIFVR